MSRLIIVTGLPASGKSVLARELARRYGVPLLGKDMIKEPLLDVVGAPDARASRTLSSASFAVLFALARELTGAGLCLVLEGNFRAGEHEAPLRSLGSGCRIAQVLCRVDEATRRERLAARARDGARHAGHADARLADAPADRATDAYLELPGERALYAGDLTLLDAWWRDSAVPAACGNAE